MVDATLPQERCDFYVYGVFRLSGEICYIGKGRRNRWRAHERHSSNPHLANLIRSAGGSLPIVKIRESLTESEAFKAEIALINAIGRKDCDLGPLVNLSSGGGGIAGYVHSLDARECIRLSKRGKERSPETCAKISTSKIGATHSPETCSKMSAASLGRPKSNGHRENIRIASIGRSLSDETRRKISIKSAGRTVAPETRAKISASHIGRHPTEETRVKLRAAQAGKIISDTTRAKISAALMGRTIPTGVVERMKATLTGKPKSPEHKASMRMAQAARRAQEAQDRLKN